MWKITLCGNIIILFLLWLLSQVAIIPADNFFVQYAGENQISIPSFTGLAIRLRSLTALIPLTWIILTFFAAIKMRGQKENKRNEWLLAHISITLCIGLTLFFFYLLASILTVLKIGYILF